MRSPLARHPFSMPVSMAKEIAPGLQEIFLPQQRLVDGRPFPRIFSPSFPHLPVDDVFRNNSEFLQRVLLENGALFFRGFALHSADDFRTAVDATGWERISYVGSAPRTVVTDGVYTASDADPTISIIYHHEMAQLTEGWPAKILFFCETKPADRGQTPILVSRKVVERMWQEHPNFMRKLDTLGVIYIKVLPKEKDISNPSGQGWPVVFDTSNRKEAEKRAMEQFDARVEWLSDGSLRTISGPFKATRKFGKGAPEVWFNKVIVYYSGKGGLSPNNPTDILFGDGSPLPEDAIKACKRIHEDLSVDIPWQKGDLMIADNLAVMHGRRPYKPPRKVLVTLCK